MSLSPEAESLRDQFLRVLTDAARPLWQGPDPEVALEALIEAAGLFRDRLRTELVSLRLEEVE